MTPKPLPTWGQWRRYPIQMTGRTIIPAAVTEEDLQIVRDRTTVLSRQEDNDDEDRPISE